MGSVDSDADNGFGEGEPEINRGSIMDQLNNGRLYKRWGHPGMRYLMHTEGLKKRMMGRDRMNHLVRFAKRTPQQQEQAMPHLDQPSVVDEWARSENKRKK